MINIKEQIKQLEEIIKDYDNLATIQMGYDNLLNSIKRALAFIKNQEEEINGLQKRIELAVNRNPYKEFGVK